MKVYSVLIAAVALLFYACSQTDVDVPQNNMVAESKEMDFWFANPSNHREEEVFNDLVASFEYANEIAIQNECLSETDENIMNWFENVNLKYHEIHAFDIDPELVAESHFIDQWINRLFEAYFIQDDLESINNILSIENRLLQSFQTLHPSANLEYNALMELSSFLKMLRYLKEESEVVVCSELQFRSIEELILVKVDDPYDDCMREKISNAGFLEIIINWGAGPGGWVAVASADCLIEILSEDE